MPTNIIMADAKGGNIRHGTFTPAEQTLTHQISELLGKSYDHILILATPNALDVCVNGGFRVFTPFYQDFSIPGTENIYFALSNAAGASIAGARNATSPSNAYFDRTTATLISNATSGYLPSGVTFEWFAW